ncbi:IclR family transcriptional regulator [Tamaricihabitans halophyticus]|uniref:Glycerol operon regulatory protein n=1 Tax=Tamaricihabitans halophyticus TaxID=1262583 RepID=A0A4V2STT7_9PSEU|nr:IclR family transcriptional regulator [Tamaricihabitans halophyticus]TCP51936.1 IclR family transcriptional regulator [Tamaricihabitans halophyticus]
MGVSSDVPALRRGLAVLRLLASHAGPMTAGAVARELELPRSSTYHLLAELASAGFVTHLPEERRYGLGVAAFELGSAYLRHDPLERLAGPLLRPLAEQLDCTVHLGALHGADALYLLREQPARPQSLVTDVGVRLPAQLPACGLAILAYLPPAQVRALLPGRASFVSRTGRGPAHLPALRRALSAVRRRGWAVEDGQVTAGYASVAAPAFDHAGRPTAAISATFRHECEPECGADWPALAATVRTAAAELTARIGGLRPADSAATSSPPG